MTEPRNDPKLIVMLSEIWTMTDPRDLTGLVDLAVAAERGGADGVLIGEHVIMGPSADHNGLPDNPRDWLRNGNHLPEAAHPANLELLAAISTVTTTLRLMAAALLSPLRHPLTLGKQLATLDLLSKGRLVHMPAVSWHKDEYNALGVPFHERGKILDEQLEVWESAWRDPVVSHHGAHFNFDDVYFEPKPWRPTGPTLWISGIGLHPPALRRAVRYGNGLFCGIPPSADDMRLLAAEMKTAGRDMSELELVAWLGRTTPFPDPSSTKALEPALDAAAPLLARGFATHVIKPSQYIDDRDQLEDLCRSAIAGLRERSPSS